MSHKVKAAIALHRIPQKPRIETGKAIAHQRRSTDAPFTHLPTKRDEKMRAAVTIPDSGPPVSENPPGHRREFSAGASWFFGMMLLVAGSTLAMQGSVMLGVIALIAGLATVAGAAVALMS